MRLIENGYKYTVELIETISQTKDYKKLINESVSSGNSEISSEVKREFVKKLAPVLENYITLVANILRPKGAADIISENITKNENEIKNTFNDFILSLYRYVDETNKFPSGYYTDFIDLVEEACKKRTKNTGKKPNKSQAKEIMKETINGIKLHSKTVYENFVKPNLKNISIEVEKDILETKDDNQPKDFYRIVEQKIGAELFKNLVLEFVFGGIQTKRMNEEKDNLTETEKQVYENAQKLGAVISKIIF